MRKLTMTVAAAALLALPALAEAQATATIAAEATVLAPIAVTDLDALAFGDVIPGVSTTIAPAATGSGSFQLAGAGILQVALDFTLPASLSHSTSASTLPISFGAGSAGVGTVAGVASATFDPAATYDANLVAGGLFVFIGGTVTPAVAQEAGDYAGTITLAVAYTGS
jgi:hypothetical protein